MTTDELVVESCDDGFQSTLARLRSVIASAGMKIFAEIDHASAARDAGLQMPPTVVILYGNPKAGTPVMLASPLAAIELPLRVMLIEGADGHVLIVHRPIAPVLERLGVDAQVASRLGNAQKALHKAMWP